MMTDLEALIRCRDSITRLESMRHQQSAFKKLREEVKDDSAEAAEKIDSLLRLISDEISELEWEWSQASTAIHKMPDPRFQSLLTLRYLEGLDWATLAGELHISRRTAFYWHKQALTALEANSKSKPK